MAMLAIALFVALFGFGQRMFGWHDAQGHVQMALVASFVCGALAAYRARD